MLAASDQSLFFAPEIPHIGCSRCKYSHRGCQRCRAKWFGDEGEQRAELRAMRDRTDALRDMPKKLPWKRGRMGVLNT
jgi:hypothetical protein